MAKFQLRQPEIDLAADARHRHIPGTAYHWKHGYIPLDARTATLFHKKAAAKALIDSGKVSIHEPEGITHINSRGLRATRTLNIVPASPKVTPKAPEPVAPKAPEGVKPISPSLAKELARYETYDRPYYGSPSGKFQAQGINEGHLEVLREDKTLDSGRVINRDRLHLTDKGRAHLEAHRGGLRKPEPKAKAGAAPRNAYDSLLTPKSGDIFSVATDPSRRYRFAGSTWVKEYQRSDGTWGNLGAHAKRSQGAFLSDIKRGNIEVNGIDKTQVDSELTSRRGAHEAASLAVAQKLFGKEKVNGFRAVSGHEATRRVLSEAFGPVVANRILEGYVPEPGTIHLVHDNGTQVRIDGTTAKKFKAEAAHRFAGVIDDVTSNYVHDTEVGHSAGAPIVFHVDSKYSGGGNWKTSKHIVHGYVRSGDTQNVHLSPATALERTTVGPSMEYGNTDHEHYSAGHSDFPTATHGTLIHELGHVADNRNNHTGIATNRTLSDPTFLAAHTFHQGIFPKSTGSTMQPRKMTPGAKYARTNPHEGYAEAFTHAVANRHLSEAAKKKRALESEAARERRAAHDLAAAKYEAKYGFFKKVSTP